MKFKASLNCQAPGNGKLITDAARLEHEGDSLPDFLESIGDALPDATLEVPEAGCVLDVVTIRITIENE